MTQSFQAAGVAVVVHADGIVEFDYAGVQRVEAADALAMFMQVEVELRARGVPIPAPTLVRMARVTTVTREAREVFAGEENARVASRVALIAHNPISRVIGSFFLGLNRPRQPVRLFGDDVAALAWLRGA